MMEEGQCRGPKILRSRRPSVRSRASTLWSEVLRMLNDTGAAECRSEDGLCAYCRAAAATTVDHLRPVGAGLCRGETALVACCASCNSSKGKREYGLWMVNKFGLSAETLARMCSLGERDGDGAWEGEEPFGRKGGSEEGMTSPEALRHLREVCYAFCADLHDRILRLRGEAGSVTPVPAPLDCAFS
jgi:5-methylcytosine-specific restriction endonuclease McrA